MSADTDRCFQTLGIRRGASRGDLKQAYRDLVKVWHPDRFTNDPNLQTRAQEKLKEINQAYTKIQSCPSTWWQRRARAVAPAVGRDMRASAARHPQVVIVVTQAPPAPRWRNSLWLPLIAAATIAGLIYNGIAIPLMRESASPAPAATGSPNDDLANVLGVTREAMQEVGRWAARLPTEMLDRHAPSGEPADGQAPSRHHQITRASPDR